nr:hypothetical protein [Escherichia coli]
MSVPVKKLKKVTFGNIDRCHAVALAACNDNGRRYRCPGSNVPVSGSMAGPNQKNICWSCIFPMRIMGIGAAPEGAAPPLTPPGLLLHGSKMGYQKSDGS